MYIPLLTLEKNYSELLFMYESVQAPKQKIKIENQIKSLKTEIEYRKKLRWDTFKEYNGNTRGRKKKLTMKDVSVVINENLA